MTKSTRTAAPVTASTVRAFFAADPNRLNKVDEKVREAAANTLRPGARGRLHPAAVEAFNKGRKGDRRYVTGATKRVVETQKAEAVALRKAAADAGHPVGSRGPLRKAVLASLKG